MANLVDPYGFPVSTKLLHGAERFGGKRPQWPANPQDTKKDVPEYDQRTLVAFSRRLYANDGLVKGAIDSMAQHAIGRAWNPHYNGPDKAWGEAAQAWLMEEWFGVCDVRGPMFDFKTSLFNDSVALDVDGDFAVALTEQDAGYPAIQHIPAHCIGTRRATDNKVEKGPWKGYSINSGCIQNDAGRIIALRILGDTEADDKEIATNDVVFVFNATRADQVRGLPTFSHAINELRDAWQSQQWEQITHQATSAISLIEHNDTGSLDPNDPAATLGTQGTDNETMTTQMMEGGLIRYFKAGSGNKLEEFASSKPGPNWEAFQDRLFRKALVGACWPYSLIWKSDGLNGPAERSQIELARATIYDRQDLLKALAVRIIKYALAKAAKLKLIPPLSLGWWKWDFTLPPKFSIDNGRDGQSRREDYKLGHKNLRDILGEQGIDYDQHMQTRAAEITDTIKRAQQLSTETGVPFDLVMNLFQQRNPNPVMTATPPAQVDTVPQGND